MNLSMLKRVFWVVAFVIVLSSYVMAYRVGYHAAMVKANVAQLEVDKALAIANAKLLKSQLLINDRVTTKYVTQIKYVKERSAQLAKEIPHYVTPTSDAHCSIPLGFQLHWNRSNQIGDADTAEYTDATPSTLAVFDTPTSIRLSDVTEQHLTEVTQCKATEEQLIQLQDWIRQQSNTN